MACKCVNCSYVVQIMVERWSLVKTVKMYEFYKNG
jgi:hypothetical protein